MNTKEIGSRMKLLNFLHYSISTTGFNVSAAKHLNYSMKNNDFKRAHRIHYECPICIKVPQYVTKAVSSVWDSDDM